MERKPLILIVEDEPDMRENLVEMLKDDYQTIAVAAGAEAISQVEDHPFDLSANNGAILLDIRLSDMSGVEVLHKINEIGGYFNVIMITALKDVETAVAAMGEGAAAEYITKPFRMEELLATIRRVLDSEYFKRKMDLSFKKLEKWQLEMEKNLAMMQELRMQDKLRGFGPTPQEMLKAYPPLEERLEFKPWEEWEKELKDLVRAQPPEEKKRKLVLIVEDEADMRENIAEILRDEFDTAGAENGKQTIEIMNEKKDKVDLVLLDIRLPDIWGIEVLKEIKKVNREVPVIMVTALSDVETAIAAMKEWAYDYITKPFLADDLLSTVRKTTKEDAARKRVRWMIEQFKEERLSYKLRVRLFKELLAVRMMENKGMSSDDFWAFFPELHHDYLNVDCSLPPEKLKEMTPEEIIEKTKKEVEEAMGKRFG